MGKSALLMIDVEHIKKYVFGTGKLKEIRGASALLDEFNRKDLVSIVSNITGDNYDKIFAGGGVAMFKMPADEDLCSEILREVSKECKDKMVTASVQGASLVVDEKDLEQDFAALQRELIHRLHEKKFSEKASMLPSTQGFMKVCESCGSYPALDIIYERHHEDELLCRACSTKRDENYRIRRSIGKVFKKEGSEKVKGIWKRLLNHLVNSSEYNYQGEKPVEEFNDLGNLCKTRKGYMGLIYCDGNNMGNHIENKIDTPEKMSSFSSKVEKELLESVVKAIITHLQPEKGVLPFDILLLSGDDLVMVTPADKVLDVALQIGEEFDRRMKAEDITLSTGLVIAKSHFPFNQFLSISENLLKSAKLEIAKREKEKKGVKMEEGCMNFMTISASGSLSFNIEDYTSRQQGSTLIRTMKPYSLSEMKSIIKLIRDFKRESVSNSVLSHLRTVIDQPDVKKVRSQIEIIDLLARIRNKDHRKLLKDHRKLLMDLLYLFDKNTGTKFPPPWLAGKKPNVYCSPVIDFTDLYDFVK